MKAEQVCRGGRSFPAERTCATMPYGRRRNNSRKPGKFQESKGCCSWSKGINGSRPGRSQGIQDSFHDKALGLNLMRNREYLKDFKLCSDMNRSVFWKDHSDHCMEARTERSKWRTDELRWITFMNSLTHPCIDLFIYSFIYSLTYSSFN